MQCTSARLTKRSHPWRSAHDRGQVSYPSFHQVLFDRVPSAWNCRGALASQCPAPESSAQTTLVWHAPWLEPTSCARGPANHDAEEALSDLLALLALAEHDKRQSTEEAPCGDCKQSKHGLHKLHQVKADSRHTGAGTKQAVQADSDRGTGALVILVVTSSTICSNVM